VTDTARPQTRLAWVTGAGRAVRRGTAVALGRGGWTVYLTARSTAAGRTGHLPGTVEETAGRAAAAPADDPGLLSLTGRALTVTGLAERYRLDVTR
jgi:NAD(P)-dependent dehydrogenase (short-subunit alcohol dehydrogenase family)